MPPPTNGKDSSHSTIISAVDITKNWIFNAGNDIGNWFVALTPHLPSMPSLNPMSIISGVFTNVIDNFSAYIWYIKYIAMFFGPVLAIWLVEKLLLLCKPFSFGFTMLNNCVRNVAFAVLRACRLAPNDADYVTAISFCIAGSSAHVRTPLPSPTVVINLTWSTASRLYCWRRLSQRLLRSCRSSRTRSFRVRRNKMSSNFPCCPIVHKQLHVLPRLRYRRRIPQLPRLFFQHRNCCIRFTLRLLLRAPAANSCLHWQRHRSIRHGTQSTNASGTSVD